MFSIKDLDVVMADIKNTNVTYMAVKDLLFRPTGGGGKAPRLPVAYQEVEYIQADGNQYIDTGYAPNNNTKIYAKFAHGAQQNQGPLFGARGRSGYTEYNYQYILWSHCSEYNQGSTATDNKPCPLFCHEYSTSSTSGGIKFLDTRYPAGTVIEFEYDKTGGYYGPDNTWTWSPATSTANINMLIFGLREGTTIDSRKFDGKLFAFKVWESGVAKRDFVPCYRKEDGEIGLYDLVNNEFYNNKGSGRFTRGANVRELVLPSRYKELTYIQSSATNPGTTTSSGQYIDTLYTPNQYTKIAIDMQFQNLTRQSRLFAIHDTNTSYMTMAAYINGSDKWARAMKNGEGDWLTTEVAVDTNRHTFTLKNGNYKIQTGNTVNYNSSNATSSTTSARHTLPLLAAWDFAENKIVDHSSARIYGCTIFEKEVMVRNFVPCVNEYGDIGLYDLVEGKFYANAGTGSFTAGSQRLYLANENTLMHYDFDNTTKDLSGNGYNMSTVTNVGYTNIGQEVVANATSGSPVLTPPVTPFNAIGTGDFVISMMYYTPSWSGSYTHQIFAACNENDTTYYPGPSVCLSKTNSKAQFRLKNNNIINGPAVSTLVGKWHNYILTRVSGVLYAYIDGEEIGHVNDNTNVNNMTNGYILRGSRDQQPSGTKCDEFIFENKGWTAEDVQKYVNRVASLYGLSRQPTKKDIVFCEYIGRNGNNYIDSEWIPKVNTNFEVKMGVRIPTTGVRYNLLGNHNEGQAGQVDFEVNAGGVTNNVARFRVGQSPADSFTSSNALTLNAFNDLIFKSNGSTTQTITVNGTTTTGNVSSSTFNNNSSYFFIDRQLRWSTFTANSDLSYCKIYENGELVKDFRPCFVKFTGEVGLWDEVEQKFHKNLGSGTLSRGKVLYTKNDITEVEYIQSTGAQYIDTGFKGNQNTAFETKVRMTGTNTQNQQWPGGDMGSTTSNSITIVFCTSNSVNNRFGGTVVELPSSATSVGTDYIAHNDKNGYTLNGVTKTRTGTIGTFTTENNMRLFQVKNKNNTEGFIGRMYYAKIRDNGTLARDFIPCYITDTGEAGLWDEVEQKFYGNDGSGSFTKGADV